MSGPLLICLGLCGLGVYGFLQLVSDYLQQATEDRRQIQQELRRLIEIGEHQIRIMKLLPEDMEANHKRERSMRLLLERAQ